MKPLLLLVTGVIMLFVWSMVHLQDEEGAQLLKRYCYICHNPAVPSHDALVAPPLAAIKMRYSRMFNNEEAFVSAVVAFTLDPSEEKALMRGALNRFRLMPKPAVSEDDIRKIALYLYRNEPERPVWFSDHFNERQQRKNGRHPSGEK